MITIFLELSPLYSTQKGLLSIHDKKKKKKNPEWSLLSEVTTITAQMYMSVGRIPQGQSTNPQLSRLGI